MEKKDSVGKNAFENARKNAPSEQMLGAGDSVIILLRFLRQVPEVSISFFAFVEKRTTIQKI